MHEQRLGDLLHVGDGGLRGLAGAGAADGSDVGDLAAGLGVERGAVEDELDAVGLLRVAVGDDGNPFAVDEDAKNRCLGGELVEAGELRRARVDEFPVRGQVGVGMFACRGIGLRALALFGHQAAEALLVDAQPRFGGHLEGQLDREAVGVVQGECVGARQHGGPGRSGGARGVLEELRPGRERAVERSLLGNGDPLDPVEVRHQFRVGRAHRVAHA